MDLSKHMLFQSVRLVGAVGIEPNILRILPVVPSQTGLGGTAEKRYAEGYG